jgi:hypothetical protein
MFACPFSGACQTLIGPCVNLSGSAFYATSYSDLFSNLQAWWRRAANMLNRGTADMPWLRVLTPEQFAEHEAKLAKINSPEHIASVKEGFASGAMRPSEEEYGFNSRIAQMFRDQLAAQQRGRSAREIYLGRPME